MKNLFAGIEYLAEICLAANCVKVPNQGLTCPNTHYTCRLSGNHSSWHMEFLQVTTNQNYRDGFSSIQLLNWFHFLVIRLENEHLNNVGKYRAFKSVPLPFNYDEDEDKDE